MTLAGFFRNGVVLGIFTLNWTCVAVAQNTTTKEREAIREALLQATKLLNQVECTDFFGKGALQTLNSAKIEMAPIRPPLPIPGSTGRFQLTALVVAVTYPNLNLVLINRLGPFTEPGKPIEGRLYNRHLPDVDFRA